MSPEISAKLDEMHLRIMRKIYPEYVPSDERWAGAVERAVAAGKIVTVDVADLIHTLDLIASGDGFWLCRTTTAPITVHELRANQQELTKMARNALNRLLARPEEV